MNHDSCLSISIRTKNKKMFEKFLLLVFLGLSLELKCILSIKSTDICFASEKYCKGVYDLKNQYQTRCEVFCQGKYSYSCGTDRCAVSKAVCDEHQNILQTLSIFFKSVKYRAEKEKYLIFNQTVKKCPNMAYTWQPSDICVNGVSCYQRKEIPMRNDNIYSLKKIVCPCKGEFNYRCGKDYCAVHSKACEGFFLRDVGITKNEAASLGIRGCGNDFLTIKKTFSLF